MLRLRNPLMSTVSQLTLTHGFFDEGTIPTQWGDEVVGTAVPFVRSALPASKSEIQGRVWLEILALEAGAERHRLDPFAPVFQF